MGELIAAGVILLITWNIALLTRRLSKLLRWKTIQDIGAKTTEDAISIIVGVPVLGIMITSPAPWEWDTYLFLILTFLYVTMSMTSMWLTSRIIDKDRPQS